MEQDDVGQLGTADLPLTLEDGELRIGSDLIILSPNEALLLDALLASPGRVLDRQTLIDAVWDEDPPARQRALDGLVLTLRRRLRATALQIHTVRGRGHHLTWHRALLSR